MIALGAAVMVIGFVGILAYKPYARFIDLIKKSGLFVDGSYSWDTPTRRRLNTAMALIGIAVGLVLVANGIARLHGHQ
jgi:hypothetical protein